LLLFSATSLAPCQQIKTFPLTTKIPAGRACIRLALWRWRVTQGLSDLISNCCLHRPFLSDQFHTIVVRRLAETTSIRHCAVSFVRFLLILFLPMRPMVCLPPSHHSTTLASITLINIPNPPPRPFFNMHASCFVLAYSSFSTPPFPAPYRLLIVSACLPVWILPAAYQFCFG